MAQSSSPANLAFVAFSQAIANADFSKLTGKEKQEAGLAIKYAAAKTLSGVMAEVINEYKQEKNAPNHRLFARTSIERMKAASPRAQIDFLGIDIVKEAADRLSSLEFLPISLSTAVALLNYGISDKNVYVSKNGSATAASALALAEASDEDIYSVVADTWLYLRGHTWANPLKAA